MSLHADQSQVQFVPGNDLSSVGYDRFPDDEGDGINDEQIDDVEAPDPQALTRCDLNQSQFAPPGSASSSAVQILHFASEATPRSASYTSPSLQTSPVMRRHQTQQGQNVSTPSSPIYQSVPLWPLESREEAALLHYYTVKLGPMVPPTTHGLKKRDGLTFAARCRRPSKPLLRHRAAARGSLSLAFVCHSRQFIFPPK